MPRPQIAHNPVNLVFRFNHDLSFAGGFREWETNKGMILGEKKKIVFPFYEYQQKMFIKHQF